MIARPDSPTEEAPNTPNPEGNPPGSGTDGAGVREKRPWLVAALVIAAVGALLIGAAPLVGLVTPDQAPAFASWPLLLALAAVPVVLAGFLLRSGTSGGKSEDKSGVASAVLIGPAVLAPGRAVLDAQLLDDAGVAARPELLVPTTLDPVEPAFGFWLLLAGHIATAVAGAVAAFTAADRSVGPSSFIPAGAPSDAAGRFGGNSGASAGQERGQSGVRRQGLLALVLCATAAAVVGMLMTQFTSDDPYLLPRAAVDSPPLVLIGGLVMAVGVLVTGGIAASSPDPDFARGGLLGLAAAVGGFVVPSLFAATFVSTLHYGSGSLIGLVALVALAVLSVPAGRAETREDVAEDFRLPALARLHTVSGVLALLAGVLAVLGASTPELEVPAGLSDTSTYPARMLWPAGLVLIAVGVGLLLPRTTSWTRPALSVVWAVLPLTVAATLDSVFTTVTLAGANAGFGAWAAGAAVVVGLAAAGTAATAGAVERDDVDRSAVTWRRAMLAPCAAAVVLAVISFSVPVVTASGYQPPGLFTQFSTTSWGLVVALVAVITAALLAPIARPARSAALLGGAAAVELVRVLELPLTAGRVAGSGPGLGFWFGLGCLVVLILAAITGARTSQPSG